MRGVWPDRIFGGDAVSVVQMGFKKHSSHQRNRGSPQAGQASAFGALRHATLLSNIFIPQVGMRSDEFAHHMDAFRIVEDDDVCVVLPEHILRAQEVSIFSNYDTGNAEKQGGSGAHNAGTEGADQRQLRPIATTAGVAQASSFGVRGWIAALNSQVVAARHDLTLLVRQNRTDGQASFAQSLLCLGESCLEQFLIVHNCLTFVRTLTELVALQFAGCCFGEL